MSLFEKIFRRPERQMVRNYFKTLTAYQPTFKRWHGQLYESEVVRSAIDAKARHMSKLKIEIHGAAQPKVQTILKKRPNQYQTWSQFIYRATTILEMQNNCFIVPIVNRENMITGLWTALPSKCKILEDKRGTEWLEYEFSTGDTGYVELARCGLITKHQYVDDFFGERNTALDDTMDLIQIEREGIKEGIKAAASFRFMARVTNFKDPEDLAIEQKNFTARNLRSSGFLLFPNTYDGIQQIQSKPYVISAEDQAQIRQNVFEYFGVNEDIILNKASGPQLDAFFDGAIEPLALQIGEVLTFMLFSDLEIAHGARVYCEANRLQYMSTGDKINFIAQLSDRGFITINEGRELLNYTPIEGGDVLPIRGEFKLINQGEQSQIAAPSPKEVENPQEEPEQPPQEGEEENGDQE